MTVAGDARYDGFGWGLQVVVAPDRAGVAFFLGLVRGVLGVALGAGPATFAGLAGIGDLVLTCTGSLSRNRAVGLAIGRGANRLYTHYFLRTLKPKALAMAARFPGTLDAVLAIPKVNVYTQSAQDFTQQSEVADAASALIVEVLGPEAAR